MKLSDRDKHIILLGVVFVALGGYIVVSRTGAAGTGVTNKSPRRESIAQASLNLTVQGIAADVNMLGIDVNGGFTPESRLLHFFHPNYGMRLNPPDQQYTDTAHRYPTVSGTNISTLIHHGYSPLMCPADQDTAWMVNPPSESYFGG